MGTVGDKGQSHITIHHNTFTLMLRGRDMGTVGDKGQGTKPHHHSLQHHITIVCETPQHVCGWPAARLH